MDPFLWHFAAYPVSELVNSLPSTNAELWSLQYAEGVDDTIFLIVCIQLLQLLAVSPVYPVSELVNSLPSTNAEMVVTADKRLLRMSLLAGSAISS